jgi:hypothetical protein
LTIKLYKHAWFVKIFKRLNCKFGRNKINIDFNKYKINCIDVKIIKQKSVISLEEVLEFVVVIVVGKVNIVPTIHSKKKIMWKIKKWHFYSICGCAIQLEVVYIEQFV